MTKLKAILTGIGFIIALALGAFSLGNKHGRDKAEAKADKQRTDEHVAATEAVAERRVEVAKEASNVLQTVNHLPDDNVDRELRESWKRPSSR